MRIFAATWFEDHNGASLTKAGWNVRLVSFYKIMNSPYIKKQLPGYVKTGIMQPIMKARTKDV